jgi:pyrroloquinoline quinone (PQQ) biosynthesis protein C
MKEADRTRLDALKASLARTWNELLTGSPIVRWLEEGGSDRTLFKIYLIETYHYVFHNSRNQALVATRIDNRDPAYLKYCLRHAYEEVGHEMMAMRDLQSLGVERTPDTLPPPLPSTEVFIAYLYWISQRGNPLQRLAYSLWAEGSYEYFGPVLDRIRRQMQLEPKQMSFFVEHAKVDEGHSKHVEDTILRHAHTEADWQALEDAALTSLRLVGGLLDGVWGAYQDLAEGRSQRFAFLKGAQP